MKKRQFTLKRTMAMLMTIAMLFNIVNVGAFAEGEEEIVEMPQVVESVETPAATPAEEPASQRVTPDLKV